MGHFFLHSNEGSSFLSKVQQLDWHVRLQTAGIFWQALCVTIATILAASYIWLRARAARWRRRRKQRMLCLDLDGTLYNSQHSVSRRNAEAVAAASRANFTVALCTGRGPTCKLPTPCELGVDCNIFLVGFNGAVVFELGRDGQIVRSLFEARLNHLQVTKVLRLAGQRAIKVDIADKQYCQYSGAEQQALIDAHSTIESSLPVRVADMRAHLMQSGPPNKMTIFESPDSLRSLATQAESTFAEENIRMLPGGPHWIDTVHVANDKAASVRLLCSKLGYNITDAVAFGDGANDATMLKACGLGIAMAQGGDAAKAAATYTSKWTNDEDAVAREINELPCFRR
jgi:Cof subfamily protein (haloacid dehalogenase superfamily)